MTRTLLTALWLIPCGVICLLFAAWIIHGFYVVLWRDAWWRGKASKVIREQYVITFQPSTRRHSNRRTPKSRK